MSSREVTTAMLKDSSEFLLAAFSDCYAIEILSWATSAADLQNWSNLDSIPGDSIFSTWHTEPYVKAFVLRRQDQLAAYGEIWLDQSEDEVELARLIVRPQLRNYGVGQILVRQLFNEASTFQVSKAIIRLISSAIHGQKNNYGIVTSQSSTFGSNERFNDQNGFNLWWWMAGAMVRARQTRFGVLPKSRPGSNTQIGGTFEWRVQSRDIALCFRAFGESNRSPGGNSQVIFQERTALRRCSECSLT